MCSPQAKRERVSQKEPVQGGTAKPSPEPRWQKEAYSNGVAKSPVSANGKMLQPVTTLHPVATVTSGDNDLSLKVGLPIEK